MTVRSGIRGLVDQGVSLASAPTDAQHIRATNTFALLAAGALFPWVPISLSAGEWPNTLENLGAIALFLFVLVLNRRGRHLEATVFLLVWVHVQVIWAVVLFGQPSGSVLYYPAMVIAPYLVLKAGHERMAHGFAALGVILMVVFTAFRADFPNRVEIVDVDQQRLMNTVLALSAMLLMAAAFRRIVDDTEDDLRYERARADSLLLNVLPETIAQRLKDAPKETIADQHREVTVLFADLVGFTPLSAGLTPPETVELLGEIFREFDAICAEEGVEKIHTIGDGYMAVCGAPLPNPDHAVSVTRAALRMRDHFDPERAGVPLQVRIGINSGEVVAGIVGTTRFHYDVWGDVVNVASRMESHGEPGKIQITESTYRLVKDEFHCEERGVIEIKGKGAMTTWFVEGRDRQG